MFDKTLFDRNAFDRSVSSDGITLTMLGSGTVGLRFTLKTPITSNLNSNGLLLSNIRMQQSIAKNLTGAGNLNTLTLILKRSTTIALSGQGALISNFTVRTPIAAALSGGGGVAIDSQMFLRQYMASPLSGSGIFNLPIVMGTGMIGHLQGAGEMSTQIRLNLPLAILQQGEGALILRRLGALNENIISLINMDLLPGETITIDTDLLQVLFGSTEDVSSITTDSIFFELNPGENEITFDMDSNTTLDVIVIWQNRWL